MVVERDNGYDNRVAGLDSPSQNRENPPLRFIVLLSRVLCLLRGFEMPTPSFVF